MNLPAVPPQAVSPTALLTGDEARAYAKDLSESTIISSFFRGSVANVMFAMELGKIYNLEPAAVLQNIHVFESGGTVKAGLSANLMVSLARNAGHIVTTEATPAKATTTIVRGDTVFAKLLKGDISQEELEHYSTILTTLKEMGLDPKEYAVTKAMWNEDKATTAGLFGKGNWSKYPHAMLAARAKTDAVRLACEEVLIQLSNTAHRIGGGLTTPDGQQIDVSWTHTADELGASVTDDGETVTTVTTARRPQHNTAGADSLPRERATVTAAQRTAHQASDAAAMAAQASMDPSKAGWNRPAEETAPKKEEMADRVYAYVAKESIDDTAALLANALDREQMDEAQSTARATMILSAAAELLNADKLFRLFAIVVELRPEMALDALTAIADAPKAYATKLAEFMQCIVLDLPETIDATDRQAYVYKVYNRLQAHDRLDDPAPFYDRAADQERPHGSLTDATKHIMQTLLRVS